MKELITFVLKPLSFLPALAIMYIIYSFSGQTGEESGNLSYEVSVKIVEIGNQVLDKELQDWEISEVAASIEYPVRKLAHMSEYFILAVAVSFPFYVYGLRGFPLMVVAGLICVGFAAGDEYHQSFVDGRGPSVIDVGIEYRCILRNFNCADRLLYLSCTCTHVGTETAPPGTKKCQTQPHSPKILRLLRVPFCSGNSLPIQLSRTSGIFLFQKAPSL